MMKPVAYSFITNNTWNTIIGKNGNVKYLEINISLEIIHSCRKNNCLSLRLSLFKPSETFSESFPVKAKN